MTRQTEIGPRHVLWALIAFFAVIAVVNVVFVALALESWTGTQVDNAYMRGLAYNDELAAARVQRDLGWRVEFDTEAAAAGVVGLTARFHDRSGRPIDGMTVTVAFTRPTHEGLDHSTGLAARGSGVYAAAHAPPAAGYWDLRLMAVRSDGTRYRIDRRVWVR